MRKLLLICLVAGCAVSVEPSCFNRRSAAPSLTPFQHRTTIVIPQEARFLSPANAGEKPYGRGFESFRYIKIYFGKARKIKNEVIAQQQGLHLTPKQERSLNGIITTALVREARERAGAINGSYKGYTPYTFDGEKVLQWFNDIRADHTGAPRLRW